MAQRIQRLLNSSITFKSWVRFKSQRTTLGKPPGEARSLEERFKELNFKDPEIYYKVDIGFAVKKHLRRDITAANGKVLRDNKNNPELEKLARKNELLIPLEEVEKEWAKNESPSHIRQIAEHYGVFDHLFGDSYFHPVVPMSIDFFADDDRVIPSYFGNHVKPSDAKAPPSIHFDSKPGSLWTLIMTTPDGLLFGENEEFCHWFIGNIKGCDIASGDAILNYIQPLPFQGLGYLRYIFVLYKQEDHIDYKDLQKNTLDNNSFKDRRFSTYQFYKDRQDKLTPAGLSFFTSDWDDSVTNYFHQVLSSECPKFIYDFPEHQYAKQEWFPLRKPFNLYLDRYRDQKEIAKEYLLKKLKVTDPFKEPPKPLPFPNAIPFKEGTPSWLKNEIRKERLGWARAKDYLS